MSKLLRNGRLSSLRKDVLEFTSSIKDDLVLFPSVVKINQAHVIMLIEQKVISQLEGCLLLRALDKIRGIEVKSAIEDVHMYIEEEVTKAVGEDVGGNLHIAKSRNDQVSTAIRMRLRTELLKLVAIIRRLQKVIYQKASQHIQTIFPGYTHLQPAQPITLAHYLLSCFDSIERDLQRLREAYPRINMCPMGACALATTSIPISRERVATLLGFEELVENSLDAVGSRDFILEATAVLTIFAVNVSRIVEDLIIWSSLDFALLELPDTFASTSSIMPQKKNPDILEVIRARMSHILGHFVTTASTLKALPSSYNLDHQEITPKLWESIEELSNSLTILSSLYPEITINEDAMSKPFFPFTSSTELANTLTRKYKIPFRRAHKTVGLLTKYLIENKVTIQNLTEELLMKFFKEKTTFTQKIEFQDIQDSLDPRKFVEKHNVRGGPSPQEVTRMMMRCQRRLNSSKRWLDNMRNKLISADEQLEEVRDNFIKNY